MQLQSSVDREPFVQHAQVLAFERLAQWGGENLARRSPEQIGLGGKAAASNQRVVDRDIPCFPIF